MFAPLPPPSDPRAVEGASLPSRARRALLLRRLADASLALLLVWAGASFVFEAHGAQHDRLSGTLYQPSSAYWRLGSRPPQRLRRCLQSVDALLGKGEPVLLWDPSNDFFRWRWAAYFLPHREVVQAGPSTPPGSVVVASSRSAPAGARRVGGEPWCGLYRLP